MMQFPFAKILALDLEGTLISNAVSQFPRPGLRDFVETCLAFYDKVVLFTFVKEELSRPILLALEKDGYLPENFAAIVGIIRPDGSRKDLRLVAKNPRAALLIDDDDVAMPGQEKRVLRIPQFMPPFDHSDDRVLIDLAARIREIQGGEALTAHRF